MKLTWKEWWKHADFLVFELFLNAFVLALMCVMYGVTGGFK